MMIQVAVLAMTSTTCYSFAGNLYKQRKGLGIGLRGSACLAGICMCKWDQLWGYLQQSLGVKMILFFHYIDDLRLLLFPIKPGYKWNNDNKSWEEMIDNDLRSPEQRTREELGKSMDSVWSFLTFTTEGPEDFSDNKLPTLDFNAWVEPDRRINYINYTKPMANNLVLQKGTALSQGCIFSSLRQDLVRRLLTTRLDNPINTKIEIITKYIQLLVNSNHKFAFIKAIILQGLTKFKWMETRNNMKKENKRYQPIHRLKCFKSHERKISKYLSFGTWYKDNKIGDMYNNLWKKSIVRKGDSWKIKKHRRRIKRDSSENMTIPTTTVMFVPATK